MCNLDVRGPAIHCGCEYQGDCEVDEAEAEAGANTAQQQQQQEEDDAKFPLAAQRKGERRSTRLLRPQHEMAALLAPQLSPDLHSSLQAS